MSNREVIYTSRDRVAKRGGSIIVPAFAIGRTQAFMYYLHQLESQQKIPKLPVYVDSPMALSATDLYLKHHEDHDLDFTQLENGGMLELLMGPKPNKSWGVVN